VLASPMRSQFSLLLCCQNNSSFWYKVTNSASSLYLSIQHSAFPLGFHISHLTPVISRYNFSYILWLQYACLYRILSGIVWSDLGTHAKCQPSIWSHRICFLSSAYCFSNIERKPSSKSHCFSKYKYFCFLFISSPESRKIRQWSDPTLVLLQAKQSGYLASH
jgi:hypothetical protein